MSDEVAVFGSMRLYTSRGVEVVVPLTHALATADYGNVLAAAELASGKALAAGWLAAAPGGLEAGEQMEPVGWVVRTTNTGRSGLTQILDLYSTNPGWVKPFLKVYLNTADEVRAFEALSGLKVLDVPEYIGEGRIERGKNPKTDALIAPVRRPLAAVWVPNAKYDEKEAAATKSANKAYTVPKRKFVRWSGIKAAPGPVKEEGAGGRVERPATLEGLVKDYASARDDGDFERCEKVRAERWDSFDRDAQLALKRASEDARKRLAAGATAAGVRR